MADAEATTESQQRARRRRRTAIYGLLLILAGTLALPLGMYALSPYAVAESGQAENPRAGYWREVRQGQQGYTAVRGQETDVLIQNGGQNWRQARNGLVATFAPWLLVFVLLVLGAFYAWRGQVKLEHRPSGRTVQRWNGFERFVHWYVAVLFVVLAITGLSLLLGRALLIPVLGPAAFAAYADLAKSVHNYLGPLFAIGIFLEIAMWARHNVFNRTDVEWFKKFGGMVGHGDHPSAGRMNGGEKVWFWIIATVGTAVIVSGFVLDFPNFGQSRQAMQLANLAHAVLAIGWIAVAFGHIYIGTVGTEGALDGMTTGRVSVEWAQQHHDLWLAELEQRGSAAGQPASGAVPPSEPAAR